MSTPFNDTVGNFNVGGDDFTYGELRRLAKEMVDKTTPDNLLLALIKNPDSAANGVRSIAQAVLFLADRLEEAQASEAA